MLRKRKSMRAIRLSLPADIRTFLRSRNEIERTQGIACLRDRLHESIPLIERHLKDRSPLVRFNALISLTRLGSKKSMPKVIECLKSRHEGIRLEAIEFISKFGSRKTIRFLKPLLWHPSKKTRKAALEAIASLKNIG